jgi:uncharacterized membrane protein
VGTPAAGASTDIDAGQARALRQEFTQWAASDDATPAPAELLPLLEGRYARGEISQETYEQLKNQLNQAS